MALDKLQRELEAREKNLHQLHSELDAAMIEGDDALAVQLQSEITHAQTLIASTQRRIELAKQDMSAAAVEMRRLQNEQRAEIVRNSLHEDVALVREIQDTIERLVKQLNDFHEHGRAANQAACELLRQLPVNMRQHYWAYSHEVGNTSTRIGVGIENQLYKAGFFSEIAPNFNIRLARLDLPELVEDYMRRAERMGAVTTELMHKVNGKQRDTGAAALEVARNKRAKRMEEAAALVEVPSA